MAPSSSLRSRAVGASWRGWATVLVVAGIALALWASAERDSGDALDVVYTPTPLPTTTATPPAQGT